MMSRDVEGGVACSFLVTYFHEFVKERDIIGLLELYSDSSVITYAGYNEETTRVAHGRQNISEHLAKMDAELGRRKVEVRFADHTPLPGGCMQVACQGVVYLRGERWVFFQVFVLAPTPYRTNTYHVASDYMRVLAVEVEQIPEGSEVMTRAQLEQRLLEEQERRARIEEARERAAAAAAEALRLQQAEALRLQQARERSEHNNNNTSVGKNISSSSNNNNNNDNNNNNNNNRNHNNNRRERTERGGDDRRRERADARRLGNNERNDNNNNQSERVERVNGGRHEERKELNGGRRWDRRERGDGGRAEGSGNTQSRDEKEPAASRPARLPRSREQPAENNNNNNRMGITRPVPRSQAAANRRIDGNENSNSNSNSNNRRGEKNTGDAVDTRPPRPRANRDRKDTDHVRLLRVPKEVKLTDISEVVVALLGTEPVDAYWHGRESANCVLRLPSSSVAERLVQDPITVLGTELKVVKFYP